MDKHQWLMQCRSLNNAERFHDQQSHPNLIHPWLSLLPLDPSPNSSFLKNISPSLLSKSNHLTNSVLSSEGVLATPLPHFSHHSPSLSLTPPSKSLLLLSVASCRNTRDPVGAFGHHVGGIRTSCRSTCSGLFWGRIVEKAPTKIREDPYLPSKPSNHSPSSLIHLPHHQEKLAFTFSHKKKTKRKKSSCVHLHAQE